jgi:hypothetical protein
VLEDVVEGDSVQLVMQRIAVMSVKNESVVHMFRTKKRFFRL